MLSVNDIIMMSNDELYIFLLPTINYLYESYKSTVSKAEFNTHVLNAIDESIKELREGMDFIELFKNKLIMNLTLSTDLSGTNSLDDYLKEISLIPLLTEDEERELFKKVAEGDEEAKKRVITANLRLVVYIAKMYTNKGLSFGDLIQEGNLGLLKAVTMFNLEKKCKFSTYAFWWIKQAMTRALADKGRLIRLPVHMVEAFADYKKAEKKLTDELNREPTYAEIAREMGVSESRVIELDSYKYDMISLSTPVGEDQDTEIGSLIPSTEKEPDEQAFDAMLPDELQAALSNSNLTPREYDVIMLRFGFRTGEQETLETVGKKYGVTRERVRQIEAKALRKLKRSKTFRKMSWWYLDDGYETHTTSLRESSGKRYVSLYQVLKEFSREAVDYAFTKLTREDKELVKLKFGEDLMSPTQGVLTKKQHNRLFGTVIPKLKNIMRTQSTYRHLKEEKEIDRREELEKRKKELCKYLDDEVVDKTSVREENVEIELDYVIKRIKGFIPILADSNRKVAFLSLLSYVKSKEFRQLIDEMPVKMAIIAGLCIGIVDDRYITMSDLSEILNITELDINGITREYLVSYKKNENSQGQDNKTLQKKINAEKKD